MATSQISAQARGVVVILQGNAWVVSPDGSKRAIKLGDEIQEGQVILTENGTRLELALPNGRDISLESGRELLIDANLLGLAPQDATNAALKDLNSSAATLARVLETGGDLSTELEATAAGLGGGDASDSHSFVRVLRISEALRPLGIQRDAQTGTEEFVIDGLGTDTPSAGAPAVSIPDDGVGVDSSDASVSESGTTTGSFTISAPDGLTSLTVGTTIISAAALGAASSAAPVVVTGTKGILSITGFDAASGKVSYTYDPSGTATDHASGNVVERFPLVVTDPQGDTNPAASLDVQIVDSTPTATADTATISEGSTSNVLAASGVLSNDVLGADLGKTGGAVVGVKAGNSGTATATADTATISEGSTSNVLAASGVLSNDVLGADLGKTGGAVVGVKAGNSGTEVLTGAGSVISGAFGELTLNADGSYSYKANANAVTAAGGSDTFTYTIEDGDGDRSTTTLTFSVTDVAQDPVATGNLNIGNEDATYIPVVLEASDVDGTVASFSLSSLPTNGALYMDAALTILVSTNTDLAATGNQLTLYFKPAADFNSGPVGTADASLVKPSFTFTAKDNSGAVSNVATETIRVDAVDDGTPLANNDTFKTIVGTPITFTRAQLLANDNLVDHARITSTSGTLPAGLTYDAATETYTYNPTGATTGSFQYTITDDEGSTSVGTVNLSAFNSTTDLATVNESALSGGTGDGVRTVSGFLFTNDAGLSGNITAMTGGTVTTAGTQFTVTTTYGTLQVNGTTGAYTYTLNAAVDNDSAAGATPTDFTQTFGYTRTGGSANLIVTITDDAPSVQNNVVEIPQVSMLTNYNLVLMLDISGSMFTGAGGQVRLVGADGSYQGLSTRYAVAKQAMKDMVTKYFSESSSVSVKVGYFSSTATAGTVAYSTLAQALAAIDAIPTSTSTTNYEDALYKIQNMFTAADLADTSKTNVAYFISDGVPNGQVGTGNGNTTPATETNAPANPVSYADFLAANPSLKSYAIGIGGGVSNVDPLDSIHNVDADRSGTRDDAILVSDLNSLSAALLATIPTAFGGNVGTGGQNPNVKIGADGGYVQYIDVLLDSNDADTTADTTVRFTFNGNNSITYDNAYLTGTSSTVTINSNILTLNAALGFTKGQLVFNFATGDYAYYTLNAATSGDQINIGFSIRDNDGDVASAVETIRVVNGKPVANADWDTLLPKNTFFEGNVITANSTDGAGQSVTVFGAGAGADNILDNARITSITFNGAVFDLETVVTGATGGGGTYSVNAAKELTWTGTTSLGVTGTFVFHADGYYRYTPPAAQTAAPPEAAQQTISFNNNPIASGITLEGVSRTGSVNAPDAPVDYASSAGVGVGTGGAAGQVNNLETLVIKFNGTTYPQGVQDVFLNINAGSSNLQGGTNTVAVSVSVFDILGNLLGQVAITTENFVALPANWSNIGSIQILANQSASIVVDGVRFNAVQVNSTATNIPDAVIGYTLTDDQGDTSSTTLTLHQITNEYRGTAATETINGSNANDAIEGFAGDDILNGGLGSDILKGGAGNDTLNGGEHDDQLYGGAGNDALLGGTGNDVLSGDDGDDNLQGGDGNDTLRGGAGTDTLLGGNNDDTLIGGAGNDFLTGGLGSDTFRWELADKGTKGTPAADIVNDFDVAAPASGGDVLDLRDLLSGENHNVGTGNLASYLHFEKLGNDTVIHVSSTGEFVAGYNASKEVQTITLVNVDLVGTFSNDQQIIQNLLNNNKLITD